MRLISSFDVELKIPNGWQRRADDAIRAIRAVPRAERAIAINARADVWAELSPTLAQMSSGKCWYCESREVRANKAIDHFRPQNRVAENPSGEGYWWLAFDWRNYRYSCTYCNERRRFEETSGGKRDHFPLVDEASRGTPEAPLNDLADQERPKLLDPTDPNDVLLLTFDLADGGAAPVADEKKDRLGHERAKISIEIYHLHEVELQEKRFEKMLEVRDRFRSALQHAKNGTWQSAYKREVAMIARAIAPGAPYSAAARAMLKGLRGESSLAQEILDGL